MWSRKELKAAGKAAFKANYWRTVLVSLILLVCFGGTAASTASGAKGDEGDGKQLLSILTAMDPSTVQKIVFGVIGAVVGVGIISLLVRVFVLNPLEVGCKNFLVKNNESPAELGELKRSFSPAWMRNVGALFLRDLFLVLWTCLFIIPGIVKAYSYRMVPYILADDPDISAMEAIRKSREMMNGHKWNTFVLDLSFIGWYLLVAITFEIVGVLWVNPYVDSTNAALYRALKSERR